MKKEIVGSSPDNVPTLGQAWLDLEACANVRLTSEDSGSPFESVFREAATSGWMAAGPGVQTIWLNFVRPQTIRQIHLSFEATEQRTQEFVLLWSSDGGASYRDIIRQQFNFSPGLTEDECYSVNLTDATDLKLKITPDISGGASRATLRTFEIR